MSPTPVALLFLLFILSAVRLSSSSSFDEKCSFKHTHFEGDILYRSKDATAVYEVARISFDAGDSGTAFPNRWGWVVDGTELQFKPTQRGGANKHSASFHTSFHINLNVNKTSSGPGGGMAFVLLPIRQEHNRDSDRSGKWLGLYNESINGQRSNDIVAIEFDTYRDEFDPDNNHVGLDLNNIASFRSQPLCEFGIDLRDGNKNITVWIDYDGPGRKLDVFMVHVGVTLATDKSTAVKVLTVEDIDLGNYTSNVVYAGFTASSGAAIDRYCLFYWNFSMQCYDDQSIDHLGIIIGVPIATLTLVVVMIVIVFLMRRNRRQRRNSMGNSRLTRTEVESLQGSGPRRFSYKELRKATGNFSRDNKLGGGASGMVYKAIFHDKTVAAVKRISCEGVKEFVAEVSSISRLHHRNVLPLIGWSLSEDDRSEEELLLVYQYMPKGSLDRWIFTSTSEGAQPCCEILDWEQRYKVLCGTAKALVYLHEGWEQTVIHRDVKASNIMLDSDFTPRLGDFGLARVTEHGLSQLETMNMAGTPGYIPPEVLDTRMVTKQADVYSFGIVILEVVCGRRPVYKQENTEQEQIKLLLDLVWEFYLEGKLIEVVDRRLPQGSDETEDMERVLKVGLLCSNPNMKERPCMSMVLQELTAKGPCSFHLPSSKPRYRLASSSASSSPSSLVFAHVLDGNLTSSDSACTAIAHRDGSSLVNI